MGHDNDNRRNTPRIPALLRVSYPNLSGFMADYSENISKHGLFIATERTHALGDVVDFEVSFPGLLEPMKLQGIVRWVRASASVEGVPGIGLELVFSDDKTRADVARIAEQAEAVALGAPAQPARTNAPAAEHSFHILLAEDNPHVREMFAYGMRKLSQQDLSEAVRIEVRECVDGADAWAQLETASFDLLIVDIYMPVLDGHALIRRVRASEKLRWLPIVAVSAGGESRKEALESGADIFLAKPVKLTDIVVTVKTLLRLQ